MYRTRTWYNKSRKDLITWDANNTNKQITNYRLSIVTLYKLGEF